MNPFVSLVWSKTGLAVVVYLLVVLTLGAFAEAQINSLELMQFTRPIEFNLH